MLGGFFDFLGSPVGDMSRDGPTVAKWIGDLGVAIPPEHIDGEHDDTRSSRLRKFQCLIDICDLQVDRYRARSR